MATPQQRLLNAINSHKLTLPPVQLPPTAQCCGPVQVSSKTQYFSQQSIDKLNSHFGKRIGQLMKELQLKHHKMQSAQNLIIHLNGQLSKLTQENQAFQRKLALSEEALRKYTANHPLEVAGYKAEIQKLLLKIEHLQKEVASKGQHQDSFQSSNALNSERSNQFFERMVSRMQNNHKEQIERLQILHTAFNQSLRSQSNQLKQKIRQLQDSLSSRQQTILQLEVKLADSLQQAAFNQQRADHSKRQIESDKREYEALKSVNKQLQTIRLKDNQTINELQTKFQVLLKDNGNVLNLLEVCRKESNQLRAKLQSSKQRHECQLKDWSSRVQDLQRRREQQRIELERSLLQKRQKQVVVIQKNCDNPDLIDKIQLLQAQLAQLTRKIGSQEKEHLSLLTAKDNQLLCLKELLKRQSEKLSSLARLNQACSLEIMQLNQAKTKLALQLKIANKDNETLTAKTIIREDDNFRATMIEDQLRSTLIQLNQARAKQCSQNCQINQLKTELVELNHLNTQLKVKTSKGPFMLIQQPNLEDTWLIIRQIVTELSPVIDLSGRESLSVSELAHTIKCQIQRMQQLSLQRQRELMQRLREVSKSKQ